jgi:hypothetical protein
LRATSNPGPDDDLSAFNTAGGGQFIVTIQNIDLVPTADGQVFFPIDKTKQVSVTFSLQATPVPEPSSALTFVVGAAACGIWWRRRRKS